MGEHEAFVRRAAHAPGRAAAARRAGWLTGLAAALIIGLAAPARAATWYWDTTTTGTWATLGNWSDNPTSGGTAPTSAPTTGDTAVFNQSTVTGSTTVRIGSSTSIDGLVFRNSGLTTIGIPPSPHPPQVLSIGSGGITIEEGSGGLTLSSVSTQILTTTLTADQSWTNTSSAALSVVSGTINASGTRTLTIAGSGSTTISAAIVNGAAGNQLAIVKQGPGLLRLSGANNSFTGGFTLDSGTVVIASAGALGLAGTTFTVNGGTLDVSGAQTLIQNTAWNGDFTFAGSNTLTSTSAATVTLGGSGTTRQVTVNASTLTLGGTVSGPGMTLVKEGPGALTVAGRIATTTGGVTLDGGLLTLSASNSFTGGVRIVSGTLAISNTHAFGGTAGTVTIEGGAISASTGGPVTLAANPYAMNGDFALVAGFNLNLGAGPFTLGGSGTRRVATVNATLGISGTVSGPGMTLVKQGSGLLTIAGPIIGTTSVEVDGGTLTLSGTNTHTGGTRLLSGQLTIGNNQALGAASGTFTIAGGSLNPNAQFTITNNNPIAWVGDFTWTGVHSSSLGSGTVVLGGEGDTRTVTANGVSPLTFAGPITGAGIGIRKAGAGELTLSGSNSFTGGVTLAAGVLRIGNPHALGATSGTFTIEGGNLKTVTTTTIATANPQAWNGNLAYDGGGNTLNLGTGAVTLGGSGTSRSVNVSNVSTIVVGGAIGGTHRLVKSGNATLVLNGSSSYSGGTTLEAGTLRAGDAQALGTTGDISFTGGTLQYTAASAGTDFAARIRNSSSAVTLNPNGLGITIGPTSQIDSTNSGGFTLNGTGSIALTGSNGYSGDTRVVGGGRLNVGHPQALGVSGDVLAGDASIGGTTLANSSGGLLTLDKNLEIIGTLTVAAANDLTFRGVLRASASRTFTVSSGSLTVSSLVLSGGANLSTSGNGTLVLTGSAAGGVGKTGEAITLGGIRLMLGHSASLGEAGIGSGVASTIGTTTGFIGTAAVIKGAAGFASDFSFDGPNAITLLGTVSYNMVNAGRTLTNNIANGKPLTLSGSMVLNTTGTVGRVLTISGSGDTVISGPMSDGVTSQGLTKGGAGALVLSGTNTYTGTTTINAAGGLLQFAKTASLYAGGTASWTAANLIVNSGGAMAFSVGGDGEFSEGNVTMLLTNLGGTGGTVNNNGLRAGSSIGFDTTNAPGSTFTIADRIANSTGTGGGAIGLVKLGSGTLVLTGSNAYSGGTQVLGGVLRLGHANALGTGTTVITSGLLDMGGFSGSVASLALGGTTQAGFTGGGSIILGGTVTYTSNPAGAVIGTNLALSGTRTFNVGGSGVGTDALTVSTVISSTGGLVKTGTGLLMLSNEASTYTGKTTIQSGVVAAASLADTGGSSSLGAPTTAGDARIDLGTGTTLGTLRYTGTGGHSTDRPIYLAGSAGGGGVLDASGSGAVAFTGGVTTAAAGMTLTLAGSNTGANYVQAITGSNVVKTGAGTWVLGTNSFTGRLTIEQGTVVASVNAPGGSGTSSSLGRQNGPIPVVGLADATGTAALLAADGVTISRVVEVAALGSGDQEVVLGGSGAGEATFDANSAFRLGRGVTLAADPGGNVRFLTPTANWQQQNGSADPAVAVTIGTPTATGTVTLETSLPTSITAVTVRQGTLRLGNGTTVGALGPSSVLTGSAGATLAFDRSDTISSGVHFASAIGGALNVRQQGSGTVSLAGVNTYTGATDVVAGTLEVDGVLGNTAVTVAAGATLSGTGTIGGPTTILGTHAPGASPGIETFTNGLTYGATSTLVWELIANTESPASRGVLFDGVDLTGGALSIVSGATLSLVFDLPGSTVDWDDAFWGTNRVWTIIDVAGGSWDSSLFTLQVGVDSTSASLASKRPDSLFQIVDLGGDLVLEYVIVPEPGALALAGLGLAMAWAARRRFRCGAAEKPEA
jgi:autotransporter-associated beta strand protein